MVLRITSLGNAGDGPGGFVGTLVEASGYRVLVDPGLTRPTRVSTVLPSGLGLVHAVVITHAHWDHAGGLPLLLAASPNEMPVMLTPATAALLATTSHSMREGLLGSVRPVRFRERIPLLPGWFITFLPAGHLLGAAMVVLDTPVGRVVCSGDVRLISGRTVGRAAHPRVATDVLCLESTYGDRTYRPNSRDEESLVAFARSALARGGHALIGTSPLGSAQEILALLMFARATGGLPPSLIWVDEQIAAANAVYATYAVAEYGRLGHLIDLVGDFFSPHSGIIHVFSEGTSEAVLAGPPAIFLASPSAAISGMAAGIARGLASDPRHVVLLPAGIGSLEPLAGVAGACCERHRYALVTHADGEALTALAERWKPGLVVLGHGRDAARAALATRLQERGFSVERPRPGDTIVWPRV